MAGTLTYYLASSRRRIAMSNLELAYGDQLSLPEKIRIAKRSFINLVTTGLELCYSPKLPRPIGNLVDPIGKENLIRAYDEGKGVLVLLSHMGNWEVCARWATENFPAVHAIVRKQKQVWVEKVIHDLRQAIDVIEIDKRNALRKALTALRKGEMVVLMLDQHTKREAVEVEFFGRPAMTSAGAALLAIRLDCAVVVCSCFRNAEGGWGCVFSKPVETIRTGDRARDYVSNTQRYVRITEDFIREHPADWMWMHRRWRAGKEARSKADSGLRTHQPA